MQLAHAVPAVLQLVQDADDDVLALARGCQWMRRTCGVSGVAVLAAEDLSVMAADGWSAADTVAARLSPASMAERCTTGVDAVALMTTPVRYAGATIGWLVARGPSERAGTLRDLGRMLAASARPSCRAVWTRSRSRGEAWR